MNKNSLSLGKKHPLQRVPPTRLSLSSQAKPTRFWMPKRAPFAFIPCLSHQTYQQFLP